MDDPRAEGDVVGSGDRGVGEIGVQGFDRVADCGDFLIGERTAGWMECGIGQIDAADDGEGQVEDEDQESVTGAAGDFHASEDCTHWEVRSFQGIADEEQGLDHRGHGGGFSEVRL
jgi:hypothetical protein